MNAMKAAFPGRLSQTFCIALRTCVYCATMAWAFSATAQTGVNGASSTSVFNGQLADGTGVSVIINGTQFTAIPTSNTCGRQYYLSGFIKYGTQGADRGTMAGTMLRCTNPELKTNCNQQDFYPVNFDATYELLPQGHTRTLRINIQHYPRQIWNKTDCKLFKTDKGTDVLIVSEVAPSSSNPNQTQQTIDKLKSTFINSIIDPHHIYTQ
jgi:hypothetical protein